jgi:hypothetical protein
MIAVGLNTLLIYLLTEMAANLGERAEVAAKSGRSDASFTLAAIGESVINFTQALSYVAFVLLLAALPAALLADRSLRRRRLAVASLRGIPDLLEGLAASVADLEGDLASKREALQETEERRKSNEQLISLS